MMTSEADLRTHRIRKRMKPALLAFVVAPLLASAANAEETRGTLAEPIAEGRLVVEVNGGKRIFNAKDAAFLMGTGRREADRSHFRPGMRVLVQHDGDNAATVLEDIRWYQYPGEAVEEAALSFSSWWATRRPGSFLGSYPNVMALASVALVSLVCGGVSSL